LHRHVTAKTANCRHGFVQTIANPAKSAKRKMDRLIDKLREHLLLSQGRLVNLRDLRISLKIEPGSKSDALLRTHMSITLVKDKIVSPSGRKDGEYKIVRQVTPVRVFIPGRERRPVFELRFPQDKDTEMELDFADKITIREGDLITLGGVKSKGKTTLCLLFTAANIDKNPVLMGNEYTTFHDGAYEPAPRFLHRLDVMSTWVTWVDDEGCDKFTLLPVREDYVEHIEKDRINIIDWINMDANQLYDISKILEGIKSGLGRGVAIVALQKKEGEGNPRGGQFVRDFSDVEILLDGYGEFDDDILLTVKGAKEKKGAVVGKRYAYTIVNEGTQIRDFREVKPCSQCRGSGYVKGGTCETCNGRKLVDK